MSNASAKYSQKIAQNSPKSASEVVLRQALDSSQQQTPINQSESDFLNSIVHELKNPLNAVVFFSEILQEEIKNPHSTSECVDYAKEINLAALGLNDLINDLLDVGSIKSGNFSIDLAKKIDLADVIQKSIRLNYAYALKRQIRIESEIDNNLKPIKLDSKRMKQIITNLISNSVKYSPDNTLILVTAKEEDNMLKITVSDQGFGMTEEQAAKAFEKYQTISNPNSNMVDSFGLGLPITKELVELQKGKIEMRSEVGKGTEVSIIFSL